MSRAGYHQARQLRFVWIAYHGIPLLVRLHLLSEGVEHVDESLSIFAELFSVLVTEFWESLAELPAILILDPVGRAVELTEEDVSSFHAFCIRCNVLETDVVLCEALDKLRIQLGVGKHVVVQVVNSNYESDWGRVEHKEQSGLGSVLACGPVVHFRGFRGFHPLLT